MKKWSTKQLKEALHLNMRLTLEYTEYADSLISDILKTIKMSESNRWSKKTEDAVACILANLYYAYLEDQPLAINMEFHHWSKIKRIGFGWATYGRVKEILDTMEILGIVDMVNGFHSIDKSYCSKYWLKIEPLGGLSLCMMDYPDGVLVTNSCGGLKKGSDSFKNNRDRGFIRRYNKFMSKQDIRFSLKVQNLSNTDEGRLNALSLLVRKVNSKVIKLSLEQHGVICGKVLRGDDNNIKSVSLMLEHSKSKPYCCINNTVHPGTLCSYSSNNNSSNKRQESKVDNNIEHTGETIRFFSVDLHNLHELHDNIVFGKCEKVSICRRYCRGSEKLGGRFYSDISDLPRAVRKSFIINGEKTAEPDFSGMHIRMLYHEEGIDYKGECYIYDKSDPTNSVDRERIKLAQLILINTGIDKKAGKLLSPARAYQRARKAIFYKLKAKGIGYDSIDDTDNIMKSFEDFHQPLKKYLYTDQGVFLQYKDSEIMINILKDLSRLKIPVFPVHDSIVVPAKNINVAKEIMKHNYIKSVGFEPTIDE